MLVCFRLNVLSTGSQVETDARTHACVSHCSLHQKLKTFLEQYTAREEYFQRQLEAKNLEIQLAETKLRHQVELTSLEAEKVKGTLDKAKEFSNREVSCKHSSTRTLKSSTWCRKH